MLSLEKAALAYGHVPLLDRADFSIDSGERVALIGRNGAGKSTLLQVCAGGRKLRYAARIEDGKCTLALTGADPESKLGKVSASDGIVVFTTGHFASNPLAVSGRGAGQEVTAMGVMGDMVSMVV